MYHNSFTQAAYPMAYRDDSCLFSLSSSTTPPSHCSYIPMKNPAPCPHGDISFGKLTSMKIVDRFSCYAVGFKKSDASNIKLSKFENFGQFGPIASLRIILRTSPVEVYIRFVQRLSATAAIQWCRRRGLDADHGYYKYCIKFLNNKTCTRQHCPKRHSWCHQKDILTKHKLIPTLHCPLNSTGLPL